MFSTSKKIILFGIFSMGLTPGIYAVRKAIHLPKTSEYINDFTRLNSTKIHSLLTPSSYIELKSIAEDAQANNLKISIAGVRHSQGGHAFYPNAIVISLKKLNRILNFDNKNNLITVQTGATWKDIQEYLHPHKRALKIMQFANLFTVGGSLSVNCNGVDPHYGPLIESIHSIKILQANGSIVTASRSENPELFSLAIGGYGLFGIILEATIEVTKDSLYKRETLSLPLNKYAHYVKNIVKNPDVGFHFSFLSLKFGGKKLFGDVKIFNFYETDATKLSFWKKRNVHKLHYEKFVRLTKIVTILWARSRLVKALHWVPRSLRNRHIISRNNIMRPPASHLYVELQGETNLLQEYFIPVDNIVPFIKSVETITKKLNLNLMHVALRFIPKNDESFLSYTTTDRIGVVLFFNQKMNVQSNEKTKKWTQHLVKTATSLGGVHYLPIQLHADKQQVLAAYPKIDNFFVLKKQYDPNELFVNHFYKKYASNTLEF